MSPAAVSKFVLPESRISKFPAPLAGARYTVLLPSKIRHSSLPFVPHWMLPILTPVGIRTALVAVVVMESDADAVSIKTPCSWAPDPAPILAVGVTSVVPNGLPVDVQLSIYVSRSSTALAVVLHRTATDLSRSLNTDPVINTRDWLLTTRIALSLFALRIPRNVQELIVA